METYYGCKPERHGYEMVYNIRVFPRKKWKALGQRELPLAI